MKHFRNKLGKEMKNELALKKKISMKASHGIKFRIGNGRLVIGLRKTKKEWKGIKMGGKKLEIYEGPKEGSEKKKKRKGK